MRTSAARIQSLARADGLLGAIAERAGRGTSLSELAAATQLNKVTAYNLLQTLAALGQVEQDSVSKRYRLGLRLLELSRRVPRGRDLSKLCESALVNLCRDTGETVNLAVPHTGCALIVDSVEGRHGVRTTAYAGERSPFHATACGKAILAFLAPAEREPWLHSATLERHTPRTIVKVEQLQRDLQLTRTRGFALDLEEHEIGAHCVAMPVFDCDARVCASISVSGLKARMPRTVLEAVAQRLRTEIAAVESKLGRAGVRLVA